MTVGPVVVAENRGSAEKNSKHMVKSNSCSREWTKETFGAYTNLFENVSLHTTNTLTDETLL